MVSHDGPDTHACARQAAHRGGATRRQDHPPLTCIVTADRWRSPAPPLEPLPADGLHAMLGGKDGEHAVLCQPVHAAAHAGRGGHAARHARLAGLLQRVRVGNAVPLTASHADGRGTVIEDWERGEDMVQHCSGVTDVRVRNRHIVRRRRGGRARGKRAQATCQTRHKPGDTCEHPDGHGAQHRAAVVATLRMGACGVDQRPPRCGAVCRAVWATRGRPRLRGARRRAVCSTDRRQSMRAVCEALVYGDAQPRPIVRLHSS